MQYELDNYDIELLNKLFDISKKILKIYNKENFFNDKLNLNYLEICLEIENELYKKININKIYDYIKYSDRANLFKTFTDYDILLNDFDDLIHFKRVYNRLNIIASSESIKNYQESDIEKNDYPTFDVSMFILNQIHDDLEKLLIFFLKTASLNETGFYKNELIKKSYLLYYLNPRIENELYDLNEYEKIIILSKSISELFNIDESLYERLLDKYFLRYIKIHINSLLNIKDIDYENPETKIRICVYEAIIKAFLKINLNYKNKISKKIHDIINITSNNKTSVLVLKKILEENSDDKNIIEIHTKALVLKNINFKGV